jgi:nucleoside-diphosphate-sugar epimerase
MLEHLEPRPVPPSRVVVLGATGFVGRAICGSLAERGLPHLALGSKDLDLCVPEAGEQLATRLEPGDALVLISARAPCRDAAGLIENVEMVRSVCSAAAASELAHLVYVSSDAVYADDESRVAEDSPAAPGSLHGAMHLAREISLGSALDVPLAILRPSLLYGVDDPHNGYGPNRFRRTARADGRIDLFGEGEEQRDHVLVDDVGEIAARVLLQRSRGVLNVATGHSASFREVATQVAALVDRPVEIEGSPRRNPITHRHFDTTALVRAFPDLRPTPLAEGLELTWRRVLAGGT